MTAKKMADIFFGNFSNLISEEKISRETDSKIESENKELDSNYNIVKKLNKKTILVITAVILLGIAIYLIS